MATKTIAYLRVSTDKQADKGISLEAQQDKACLLYTSDAADE